MPRLSKYNHDAIYMPLYRFKGIDVFGVIHRGKLGAPTEKHLADLLLTEGIVVLTAKPAYRFYMHFISASERIVFYRMLSQLLSSGVLLPDALEYVAMNSKNIFFQECVYDLSIKVSSGQSFLQALLTIPAFTSPTINFMIHAGQQAGHLEKTCNAIANYLERAKNFRKNLLSALFMPALTVIALIGLVSIISQFMLPRLLSMMDLFKKNKNNQLQNKVIFNILRVMNMQFFLYFLLCVTSCFLICFLICKTKQGRALFHRLLLHIPFIKTVLIYAVFSRIFFMLSLLLTNGISLAEALVIINQMIVLEPIKVRFSAMANSVKNGMMLSAGLSRYFGLYDTFASLMMCVAEKSGSICQVSEQLAIEYDNKIKKIMEYAILIIQPLIIVVIGLFITLLMISLYAPLVEFSMNV